jgi:hypothetical protein
VAAEIHARIRCDLPNYIENLGKRPLEQSGKHRVNENDEEIFAACGFDPRIITGFRSYQSVAGRSRTVLVIAGEAKQSTQRRSPKSGLLRRYAPRNDGGSIVHRKTWMPGTSPGMTTS